MIDPPALSVSGAAPRQHTAVRPPATGSGRPRLPVPAPVARVLLLAVAFVCAACGLVYELELVALASYLTGDSVTQTSVVLSVMVFAMGIGSLAAKRLRCRAVLGFGLLEAALALTGGSSAMALYASFAWFDQSRTALVGFSLLIGVLIGAEIPLLMTLIQRIRRQDAGGAVADLFAADYVGALVGGLAFPFLLLPLLGQLHGALLTGAVNTVAGGAMVLWLFRRDLTGRERAALVVVNAVVLALLATAAVSAGPFESAARRAVYGADVRVAVRTDVQDVVLVGPPGRAAPAGHRADGTGRDRVGADRAGGERRRPLALYLDGRLRASARDRYRYEALVHPAMNGPRRHVLVLGGGDGLAVREVLRHREVTSVTVVARDPGVLRLGRTDPGLTELNGGALGDPRVRAVTADAFAWLRERAAAPHPPRYDVVVSDLPSPGGGDTAKLYSQEFYGLVRRVMADGGRLAVRAGPDRSFWTVEATLRSAGLRTAPYRMGPGRPAPAERRTERPRPRSAREGAQGYVLAARDAVRPGPPPDGPRLRGLTAATVRHAVRETSARRPNGLPPSTLMHPRYTD
ncbi:spermidine synthase [Streptomyces meridianus]|uniref:Polyamine aminopropyltransferase n=1 Tax=Streptomyces meridianus TaxID=2938945 RepID=A0ABT0X5E9_9ACTN|nr:spermidine synthase [Streptomyces meridianus]MCM2577763.1 spermidine synthase [Streptomyces meridianus]